MITVSGIRFVSCLAGNSSEMKCLFRFSCSPINISVASLVSGFEMDLIRILEKMSSNKALKYLNLGQNTRQR